MLVPSESPLLYPGPEIDEALLKLLTPTQADDTINFSLQSACLALARRGRVELFGTIAEEFISSKDTSVRQNILDALVLLAQVDPGRFNPGLTTLLQSQFENTNLRVTELLWAIWSADLRALSPEIERMATRTDKEYESGRAASYGGEAKPVKEAHFHLARQITALWSEPDALTRARMLTTLGFMNAAAFVGDSDPAMVVRMQAELHRTAAELSPSEKTELAIFLKRLEAIPPVQIDQPIDVGICHQYVRLVRETVLLPKQEE